MTLCDKIVYKFGRILCAAIRESLGRVSRFLTCYRNTSRSHHSYVTTQQSLSKRGGNVINNVGGGRGGEGGRGGGLFVKNRHAYQKVDTNNESPAEN